jgi:hypothetical protein
MVPKPTRTLELECTAMEQGGNYVSALGSTRQYSRQKCVPSKHAQMRTQIVTTGIGTSTYILSDSQAAIKALEKH